jgi:hypothetical protein
MAQHLSRTAQSRRSLHRSALRCSFTEPAIRAPHSILAAQMTVCGQTGLAQPQPMLTQKLLACAASLVCQRSIARRTGHLNRSILLIAKVLPHRAKAMQSDVLRQIKYDIPNQTVTVHASL